MNVWCALLIYCLLSSCVSAQTLRLYDYHQHPPFNTDDNTGLSHDLVAYLNEKLQGEPRLELWLVNRARLAQEMADPVFNGMVAWVNPAWVGDPAGERFLWSRPIMHDTNELLSGLATPITYHGPESLKGKSFGGIEGYRYQGIDEAVAQGTLVRHDAKKVKTNLNLLMRGRIDATSVNGSALGFFISSAPYQGAFFVSPLPQSRFTRHLLLAKSHATLQARLNIIADRMESDPVWQAILAKYHITP
ncbi:substrate-binding periplasmic protein [Aeromonas cavernicola]|uniref:ABC transporter substrate-binding protein n=1 Tax=Aeromonas cavernicola TaxID=1006623 RepID=A0A2H9U412_9GAMM|nr:ABC transporter substrate-binding protein [Aeromonas cavernicola]PJG58773.1 ABC transporter substrate-binding protein [Aeromonas cavernicola]